MNEKVSIDKKSNLVLQKEATFNDIKTFFDTTGISVQNYLYEFYLLEIWDNGGRYENIANQFLKKFKSRSQDNVYKFFLKHKLYVPSYPKAEEDCELFFHTRFIES